MKKFFFILALLLFIVQSFSQTPALSKGYYLKKSKNQKKVGWILLAGGTIIAVGGAIGFNESWYSGSNTATDTYGFLMLGGLVSDIVSIPFFISSVKNKRRAFSVAIKNQKIFVPQQKEYALNTRPTLTLKFKL